MTGGVIGNGAGNMGAFGVPQDPVALTTLVLGALLLFEAPRKFLLRLGTRSFLFAAALTAFVASIAYVHVYLRGGPRIIDATSYYLEASALARGDLAWEVPTPAESFRGRFLLAPSETTLTSIFPIGYPLLLSLAFRLHAPLLLGPCLGAGLVVATYRLARVLGTPLERDSREAVARAAALLSASSGCMRYHTADTMSHGLATLLATLAFTEIASLTSAEVSSATRRSFVVASFCTSYLAITRFASALPLALLLLFCIVRKRPNIMTIVATFFFPVVFACAQLGVQRAQTGSYLTPAQTLYYQLSDGPVGCFRYGFGKNVGCMHEHGDFVRSQLPHGYGAFEALKTTGRRLLAHGVDAANGAILLPLVVVGLRRLERARGMALGYLVLHVLAYVPFYFDGNYPGGGARFFSELVPLEQVLLALGTLGLLRARASSGEASTVFVAPAGALVAFALHASFAHLALRDRDEGVPFFRPEVLEARGVRAGLVFVDSDHGFNLGHAYALERGRAGKLVVARYRGDAFDRLLYERLKPEQTFRYERHGATHELVPFVPPPLGEHATFEAESFWPPRALSSGFAYPEWPPFDGARGLVYVFYGGAPIVTLPEGAVRYRLRSCSKRATPDEGRPSEFPSEPAAAPGSPRLAARPPCRAGEWRNVPNDRRVSLATPAAPENAPEKAREPDGEPRKSGADDPAAEYAACDAIEVSFPVAPGP